MQTKVTEKYTYEDSNEHASTMRSSDGRWFERTYSATGKEIYYKDYKGLEKTTMYDDNDRVIQESDSKGNIVDYTYDYDGRLIEVSFTSEDK